MKWRAFHPQSLMTFTALPLTTTPRTWILLHLCNLRGCTYNVLMLVFMCRVQLISEKNSIFFVYFCGNHVVWEKDIILACGSFSVFRLNFFFLWWVSMESRQLSNSFFFNPQVLCDFSCIFFQIFVPFCLFLMVYWVSCVVKYVGNICIPFVYVLPFQISRLRYLNVRSLDL